jgi:hypothetical protein
MRAFARLPSFADWAAGFLDTAYRIQSDFRQLTPDEVGANPPPGTVGWYLNQAWKQGMATPDLGVALVHKTLHHKRPTLVPLLDGLTIEKLHEVVEPMQVWRLIWDDLRNNRDDFYWLEDEFNRRARAEGTVTLSWLRLYDILLWMHVKGQRVLPSQGGAS